MSMSFGPFAEAEAAYRRQRIIADYRSRPGRRRLRPLHLRIQPARRAHRLAATGTSVGLGQGRAVTG